MGWFLISWKIGGYYLLHSLYRLFICKAEFNLLSKAIARLGLLCSVIGLRISTSFSANKKQNQSQFLRTTFEQATSNSWEFCNLFAPLVIGRSDYVLWYWFFDSHLQTTLSL